MSVYPAAVHPWLTPQPLAEPDLGPMTEITTRPLLMQAFQRLSQNAEVAALVLFGSRARGTARPESDLDLLVIVRSPHLEEETSRQRWMELWHHLCSLPIGVDLVVAGRADAERLAGSRWHVIGYAAREGKVLYVAG
jgi:predicted nucleotidyltransferase